MELLPAHLVPLGELETGGAPLGGHRPREQKKPKKTCLPGASVLSTACRTLYDERLEVGLMGGRGAADLASVLPLVFHLPLTHFLKMCASILSMSYGTNATEGLFSECS